VEESGGGSERLSPEQARAAAALLSALDVALQRHALRLDSPFGLEAGALGQWRERLFQLAGALERVVVAADGCLAEPDSVVGDLRDVEEVLRVPCEVVAAGGVADEPLRQEYQELMTWLVGYLSYGTRAVRFWMVSEPGRFRVGGGGQALSPAQ